jgi:excisionase family DNA binding protein
MRGFRGLQGMEGDMEIYLTIAELAGMVKLSGQTIRRYVLNKTISYHKIQKAVRFRLSEIETWIDGGGISGKSGGTGVPAGDHFGEGENGTIAGEGPPESAELQAQEEKPHEQLADSTKPGRYLIMEIMYICQLTHTLSR